MRAGEYFLSAFDTFRAQPIRTVLTLVSIAIGIVAIVAAGGAATALEQALTTEITASGAYSLVIQKQPSIITSGEQWRRYMRRRPISYGQASEYKRRIEGSGALVSLFSAAPSQTVRAGTEHTDPDVTLVGSDEAFFPMRNYQLAAGRPLVAEDIFYARMVAVIGNDVRQDLFPADTDPVGKEIQVQNQRFTIVGVLARKGGIFGQSQDNMVIIPIPVFVRAYAEEWNYSVSIFVRARNQAHLEHVFDESIGILRSIRNVRPGEENDFEIEELASIANQLGTFLRFVGLFGAFCGGIALVAAGVGIMNIMLISVRERTREIGVRKAVGATVRSILVQFLVEAIVLCQIGALGGIVLGMLFALLLSHLAGIELTIPIGWVVASIGLCTLVGVGFGAYPALKAARLNPIEALRYE
ncbi:MAG: ABC transporter permease [Bacteroidota bacterium]|nr:ABC transporter permease [Candidatus Kapabacteria bacterium]MDW8075619.1 ABC transporter permease [Bacteroidota bacterium]